jgi:hypothetical protein
VQKIQEEHLHSLEVRQHPTTKLNEWIDAWHAQKSIWAESCRSWYKRNTHDGRVYIWCGSMPHLLKSLKRPRWEDFRIRYWEEEEEEEEEAKGKKKGNMWAFLGNGTTVLEAALASGSPADLAPYIRASDHQWDISMPAQGGGALVLSTLFLAAISRSHLCTKKSCPIRASPRSKRLFALSMAGRDGQIQDSLAVVIPR